MTQIRNSELVEILSNDFVRNTGEEHISTIATAVNYSAARETVILATGGAAGITILLPPVADNFAKSYYIKKVDAGVGVITIDGNAAETIDGALTQTLTNAYDALHIVCNGTAWHIAGNVGAAGPPPVAHNLLSATHPDTVVQAPSVGSLIYGDNTPDWNELVHPGAAGYAFITTAAQVTWDQTPAWTGLHTFGAGWVLTGGTGDLNGLDLIIDADGDTYLHEAADDHVEFVLATASGQLDININGADDFTFTANSFNVLAGSHILMADDTWIGLGAGAGRIAFDVTPAPDTLFVYDANLDVQHHAAVGTAAAIAANEVLEVGEVFTNTTGDIYGIYTLLEAEPPGYFTSNFHAIFGHARIDTAQGGLGLIIGVEGFASVDDTINASPDGIIGGYFYADAEDGGPAWGTGVWIYTPAVDNGSLGGGYGIRIDEGTVGAGFITTLYGIFVAGLTVGNTNWAIYTNVGDIHFGDDVELDDGAGDSPQLRFIGGSNDDTVYVFLDDDAVANDSDLVIRLCAADTGSQMQIQDSGSNVVAYIDADGNADFEAHGAFGGAASIVGTNILSVQEAIIANAGLIYGVDGFVEAEPSGSFTSTFYGVRGIVRLDTAQTQTSGALVGVNGAVTINDTITASVNVMRAGYFYTDVEDATACVIAEGIFVYTPLIDNGALTTGYGIRIFEGTIGAGSVTNLYGLYVDAIDAATTLNYSIYTAGGVVCIMNGDTGIGTATPNDRLEVREDFDGLIWNIRAANLHHDIAGDQGVGLKLKLGASEVGNEANKWAGIMAVGESAWENTVGLAIYTGQSFLAAPTEKVRINAAGNVGIADLAPTEGRLVVVNSAANNNAILYLYRDQGTVNLPGFYLWLVNVADDEAAVYVRHDGTGDLMQLYDGAVQVVDIDNTGHVTLNSITGTTGNTLAVTRNLAAASTDSAVVKFFNDNAGDDQRVLEVIQDGSAMAFNVTMWGTAEAAYFNRDVDAAAQPVVSIVQDHATGAQSTLLIGQHDVDQPFITFSQGTIYTGKTLTDEFIKVIAGGNVRYVQLAV